MKGRIFLFFVVAMLLSIEAKGQAGDSLDVFFRHLRLNEVEVTGLTGTTKMRDMAAPVSVVTARELRSSVGTNIIDVVSQQPGVSQLSTGGAISKPIIRGLGYNRVLVAVDGVRQEGQQWGDEHGVEVDGASVATAEILKGPASLMYGSDAMGGVLLLKSVPVSMDGEVKGSVQTGYQTNNGLFDYSLHLSGHEQWLVWDARYSERLAHQYKNGMDGYVPGTQFRERSGGLMLGLDGQWGHSYLRWNCQHLTPSMAEGERDEATGELLPQFNTVSHSFFSEPQFNTVSHSSYHKTLPFQQVRHYKATWDNALRLGTDGMLKAIVAYQQNRRQEFEDDSHVAELYFRLHTLTYDFRYQQSRGSIKLSTGAGGMWQKSENLAEETLIPEYHLFDIGAYATASFTQGRWTHSGGLRFDNRHLVSDIGANASERLNSGIGANASERLSSDYCGLTGSLGTVFHATDCLNLRFNVARGFRAPNMSELGSDGVHEGTLRYETGNASLKAERSLQADLGGDYSCRYASVQLSLFLNHIDNYIFTHSIGESTIDDDGHEWRTFFYAQGTARLYGFEASLDIHPFHKLHLGNTFSFVRGRLLHKAEEMRHLPMMPAPRWDCELKYELTHHRRSSFDNAFVAIGMECNLEQNHYFRAYDTETYTPSYTLFNISSGTDIVVSGRKWAEVYVSVQNVFDRVYQNHLSRLKYTDVNPLTGRRGISAMGRNASIRLIIPVAYAK